LIDLPPDAIHSRKLAHMRRLAIGNETGSYEFPRTLVLMEEHFIQACVALDIPVGAFTPSLRPYFDDFSQRLLSSALPDDTRRAIRGTFSHLRALSPLSQVSARSCCDAEDTPGTSFSGVFDSIHGAQSSSALERSVKQVYASVFAQRAFEYYVWLGIAALPKMSVALQPTLGGEGWFGGVMQTQADDMSPLPLSLVSVATDISNVTSGETLSEDYLLLRPNARRPDTRVIVQAIAGSDTNEDFRLNELSAHELLTLALDTEDRFNDPLEIEWLCDSQRRYHLLQAKPIPRETTTVYATDPSAAHREALCTGLPVGTGQVSAPLFVADTLQSAKTAPPGQILVTSATDPDWTDVIHRSAAVITRFGSRASHVAREAREADVLALVGCGDAISALRTGDVATLVCSEGVFAAVYPGRIEHRAWNSDVDALTVNSVSSGLSAAHNAAPEQVAFDATQFIASLGFPEPHAPLDTLTARQRSRLTGYRSVESFVITKLVESLSLIALAFHSSRVGIELAPGHAYVSVLTEVVRRSRTSLGLMNVVEEGIDA